MKLPEAIRSHWRALTAVAAVVIVAAIVAGLNLGRDGSAALPSPLATPSATVTVTSAASPSPSPSPVVSPTPSPSDPPAVSSSPSASPSRTLVPADSTADCQPMGDGFVPTGFTMEDPAAREKVLALGTDADGNIAAPPKDMPRTASWWNEGPRPGSTKGKVVLSIHTYSNGNALGNEMYAGGTSAMEEGDLIKLYGKDGRVACYGFVQAKKIDVADYDPASNVMIDKSGDPLLTIIVCWDKKDDGIWHSRVFFYAKPVTA